MTLAEFKTILATTQYPVAYLAFPATESVQMPYIIYQDTGSDNFGADNMVYVSATRIQIDLFTKTKNVTAEATLTGVLDANGIYWDQVVEWDNDEACYRMTYEVVI